ncbi:hypothetical protein FUT84_10445 [Treponema phagedenis]|uniref:Uncharacterized protein n=1 Tax=Treponema phagedenis TaxID=162 RepID=A0AAE6M7C2_TREPH|nr:hypothetical protein FUT79_04795 [Treponema phagedenis]QEJ98596.1 hypothetical protein FUT82_11705 [Treponema phagedenis]QEK01532.1 hypothetical protein FUT84_10445 [Treponema phagedenis]QEK04101.1 hypothetical protein FUT83_10000 [Treponema phagedenis]QEK06619.1 hypothetical protein FUT80_07740 [Treponema phagedenis]
MVPRSSDVLKQDYLQSFKTRRVCFATDGKIRTATDGGGSMQKRCFKARLFAKLLNSQGLFCHGWQNQNRHGRRWFHAETMF